MNTYTVLFYSDHKQWPAGYVFSLARYLTRYTFISHTLQFHFNRHYKKSPIGAFKSNIPAPILSLAKPNLLETSCHRNNYIQSFASTPKHEYI